LFFFIFAPQKR